MADCVELLLGRPQGAEQFWLRAIPASPSRESLKNSGEYLSDPSRGVLTLPNRKEMVLSSVLLDVLSVDVAFLQGLKRLGVICGGKTDLRQHVAISPERPHRLCRGCDIVTATSGRVCTCSIPDDCIDFERCPLFMARSVMRELIEQLKAEARGVQPHDDCPAQASAHHPGRARRVGRQRPERGRPGAPLQRHLSHRVERFNGRISDVLGSHRFNSSLDLDQTLLRYVALYNHQLHPSAPGSKTPLQTMKTWHLLNQHVPSTTS